MAIANRILTARCNYGESTEDLEEYWERWSHHIPFDAPVVKALARLYEQKLENLRKEKKKDDSAFGRLERKLKLAQKRAAYYSIDTFSQGL